MKSESTRNRRVSDLPHPSQAISMKPSNDDGPSPAYDTPRLLYAMSRTHPLGRYACLVLFLLSLPQLTTGQEVIDYTALGDPSYAQTLGLSDEQTANVVKILAERRQAIVAAAPEDRPAALSAANEKLANLLTPQQRQAFGELVAGGKLRFRFQNEPWGNVLRWFATQADLALVMNEVPAGQFSYTDAKNHTPTQAIDLLNSVLQGKGFTLVRRDKMLIVTQLTQGLPYDQMPEVSPADLTARGKFEYVSVVFPLEGRPVDQVTQEVSAFLGPNARATPLPTTGQLMVVDTAGRLEAIRQLIASIPVPKKPQPKPKPKPQPKPKPPAPVFQVHSAQGLDLGAALKTLEQLYGDAKLTGDAKVEQITAFTIPARQQAIAQTLEQMKVNVSGDNERRLEIYSVIDADLEQLREVLTQTHPGVQVSADPSEQRLLVVGTARQHRDVTETLEKLDAVESTSAAVGVAVFNVEESLAPKIVELLQPLIPRASVIQNESTIAVRGSAADQQIAKVAIEQLQQTEQSIERPALRFYRIKAPTTANYLESVRAVAPQAKVTKVPDREQLAIVSTQKEYTRLVEALDQVEAELADPEAKTLQRWPVTVDDADRLLSMMRSKFPKEQVLLNEDQSELLIWTTAASEASVKQQFEEVQAILPAKRMEVWKSYSTELLSADNLQALFAPLAPLAEIKPDAPRQRLMVQATEAEHEKLAATVAAFQGDGISPTQYKDVLLAYSLNRGDPESVAETLAGLYPENKFSADKRTSKILVTAPLEQQKRIQAVLEQLDSEPGQMAEIARSYATKSMAPSTLVQLLSPLYPNLRMTPQDSQKQLAVIGSPKDHERLKQSMAQLDQPNVSGKVVAYEVGDASPTVVRSILRQLVPSAIVSADSATRRVVVWADEQDHAKVKQAVEQYTKQPAEKRTTQVYRLKFADPDSVEYILRDLMPGARFIEDSRTGTVTATATKAEHEQITSLIQQMDVSSTGRRITEIYRFDRTDARSAERTFERLSPRARVSSIYGTNAIVVSASAEEHELFREVAEKINGGDTTSVAKVYPLDKDKINVDDVLDSIDEALRSRVAIRMNEQTNSLIVRGSPEDQAQVKQLVDELLEQVPMPPKRIATVYRLQHSEPEVVADVLQDLLDDARFRADEQTGTVTATALPEEHAEIAQLLRQLDIPSQERQQITEIYRFDRTDAYSAERTFERLVPRARVSSIRGTNSVVVTATAAEHDIFRETAAKLNGGEGSSVTKVYPLDKDQIDAEDVLASLDDSLKARLAIRINEAMNSLIVRGAEKDQATVRQLIDEIVAQVPPLQKKVARVYQFENGRGDSAISALQSMFREATFSYDYRNRAMLATASEKDQARIAELMKQLDQPSGSNKITKVYRLDSLPASRMDNIAEDLISNGEVTYDSQENVLVVSATPDDHQRVQEAVEAMNQASRNTLTEKVYTLKSANPANVQGALERLIPQARVASDMESRSIIVSAGEADHQRIEGLISQLDEAPGQEAVMRAYVVKYADAKQTFESLKNTFNGNGNFSLSFQEASKTLFVVATPKNHDIFDTLLTQLDTPSLAWTDRTARTYPLTNLSTAAAQATITALLQGTLPTATVQVDNAKNQVVVVGTAKQHQKVSETLGQMDGEDSDFEVFDLAYVDPWTVESAIETLYEGQPASSTPSVSSDYFSQRLFVRGSNDQISQVRKLLVKMGETSVDSMEQEERGDVRTIPFRGDVESAVRRIEQIWPTLRNNRIQVISPSDTKFKIESTQPLDLNGDGEATPTTDEESSEADPEDSVEQRTERVSSKYIALQNSTRAAEPQPESISADPAQGQEIEKGQVTGSEPIVIVTDEDQITIASPDHEALDQLEELLNLMSRTESTQSGSMGGDFAVFLLRNTGASAMRELLANLFEQLRETSGGGSSTSRLGPGGGFGGSLGGGSAGGFSSLFGPMFGRVAVVADDRLNALIIHGNRQERELIKELLTVLDSEDLPNPILVHQPELVQLQHTQAQRVLAILSNVYRSQLTSGGGRRKVEIPEGVSSAVASVLQQINAASSAPVLTLDVDETTNSIIMRAPPELRKEIKRFVESLDTSAGNNRSRNVRVVQLKNGKSDQISEVLQQFLLRSKQRGN